MLSVPLKGSEIKTLRQECKKLSYAEYKAGNESKSMEHEKRAEFFDNLMRECPQED